MPHWLMCALIAGAGPTLAQPKTASGHKPTPSSVEPTETERQRPIIRKVESVASREGIEGMLGVEAIFDVEAEPAEVLDVVWNVQRFQETFPDVEDIQVLERKPHELVLRVQLDAVLAKVRYTMRRTFEPAARRVRWVELGGDLERVRGSWEVTPLAQGRRSRVIYRSFVVVSTWMPEAVYRELALRKVEEMIERLRTAATRKPTQ